jgi:DNA-binding NtrC family response regulator
MGELALAAYARTRRPEIAVVYTTGAGVNDGTRALFVERHWFLAKPYRPSDLEIILRNALGSRKAHSMK